jgi:LmbE family N-acetylglucosaminyl deacetylase
VRSLLWVGAHPDDELWVAPLLGRLCVEEGLACALLVLTRGEAGKCLRAQGCGPDLGAVRAQEMRRAARLFGARLYQWSLADGGGSGWGAGALGRVSALLSAVDPDLVLTFDPRHGSTCHPDHRAAAALVLEGLERSPRRRAVYLVETLLDAGAPPGSYRLSSAADALAGGIAFDANQALGASRAPAWHYVQAAARIHASQFDADALRALARVPARQRAVFLAPAALALASERVAACE